MTEFAASNAGRNTKRADINDHRKMTKFAALSLFYHIPPLLSTLFGHRNVCRASSIEKGARIRIGDALRLRLRKLHLS